jgi:hypothetical protein
VELFCLFGGVNTCPGILLDTAAGKMGVKIVKLASGRAGNYVAHVDLAGLLRGRPDP